MVVVDSIHELSVMDLIALMEERDSDMCTVLEETAEQAVIIVLRPIYAAE